MKTERLTALGTNGCDRALEAETLGDRKSEVVRITQVTVALGIKTVRYGVDMDCSRLVAR